MCVKHGLPPTLRKDKNMETLTMRNHKRITSENADKLAAK